MKKLLLTSIIALAIAGCNGETKTIKVETDSSTKTYMMVPTKTNHFDFPIIGYSEKAFENTYTFGITKDGEFKDIVNEYAFIDEDGNKLSAICDVAELAYADFYSKFETDDYYITSGYVATFEINESSAECKASGRAYKTFFYDKMGNYTAQLSGNMSYFPQNATNIVPPHTNHNGTDDYLFFDNENVYKLTINEKSGIAEQKRINRYSLSNTGEEAPYATVNNDFIAYYDGYGIKFENLKDGTMPEHYTGEGIYKLPIISKDNNNDMISFNSSYEYDDESWESFYENSYSVISADESRSKTVSFNYNGMLDTPFIKDDKYMFIDMCNVYALDGDRLDQVVGGDIDFDTASYDDNFMHCSSSFHSMERIIDMKTLDVFDINDPHPNETIQLVPGGMYLTTKANSSERADSYTLHNLDTGTSIELGSYNHNGDKIKYVSMN